MIKLKLTKIVVSTLVVASVVSLNSIGVSASWRQDPSGWWNTEGSSWSVGWRYINEEWYYFGNDGYMKTGWIQNGDKWYYLNDSGVMVKNTIINGYCLSADGTWTQNISTNSTTTQSESKLEDFTMKTEESVYDIGTTDKIKFYITNNTNQESNFDEYYSLERFENKDWHKVNSSNYITVNDVILVLSPKATSHGSISMSNYRGNLTPGKYRIVKKVDKSDVTAEFELK